MSVSLQVSIGEAIDKLSILDIKRQKIQDERLLDVQKEYMYLYEPLKTYIDLYRYYYVLLYKTNLEIWDVQDQIREEQIEKSERDIYYKKIVDLNDSRFLIKNKLNLLCRSDFKEQKGYKKRKLFFIMHLGLGDAFTMNGAIRYFSLFYDQVDILAKNRNYENVKQMFADDLSIVVIPVKDSDEMNAYMKLSSRSEYDVINSGFCHPIPSRISHSYFKGKQSDQSSGTHFIHEFYNRATLNFSVYTEYFFIPESPNAQNLYEYVKEYNLVFCHNHASDSIVLFDDISQYLSDSSYLVVNPNKNMYSLDHPLYNIADSLVGKPFLEYLKVLQSAWALYLVDSSFFAYALPMVDKGLITTTRLFCKPRSSQYDYSTFSKKFTYLK
jgi:hypothetical protein